MSLFRKIHAEVAKGYHEVRRVMMRKTLEGSDVVCPVCTRGFITFLPFGLTAASKRANAQCPGCFSLERTRLYWLYLKSLGDFFQRELNILHVAPETPLFNEFSKIRNFRYYPVDRFDVGYTYPKGTVNMDVTSLDYPDNFFDFILCSHVLEHVEDEHAALDELRRVLRPDGFGIVQVPVDSSRSATYEDSSIRSGEQRTEAFGQFDHVRLYGLDYKDRLQAAGFDVHVNDFVLRLTGYERFRYGLNQDELLYIVRKADC